MQPIGMESTIFQKGVNIPSKAYLMTLSANIAWLKRYISVISIDKPAQMATIEFLVYFNIIRHTTYGKIFRNGMIIKLAADPLICWLRDKHAVIFPE